MNIHQLYELQSSAYEMLQKERSDDGMWRGMLSSSAISTSVSVFALQRIDSKTYDSYIKKGIAWLRDTMKPDGTWGDSVESPSNMTATLLTYVAFCAIGEDSPKTRSYLNTQFEGNTEEDLIRGVLNYYGKDLTFSVPILMMCALAGVIRSWKKIPPFPFELATLPQQWFRYLNLPVVSYAIPALIAIGICQMRRKRGVLNPVRELFVPKAMRVLRRMQPADGGYLEAAPLTAFVSMCLAESGMKRHEVTRRCAEFLVSTVREDGSWPIDTDLSCWVTSLSAKVSASAMDEGERTELLDIIKGNMTTDIHPFTGAKSGGWGWSSLSGSVPDGDDTSGALVALFHLLGGKPCAEVECGLEWLMWLQNNDGGMPTFCKGWGKLPFDRSAPDITAHAILAMGLWIPRLEGKVREKVERSFERMLGWMKRQTADASSGWVPLWFGDQDAEDEKAPVYGTATAIDYLMSTHIPEAVEIAESKIGFIVNTQNEDGGWGGNVGVKSKVTYTARALGALAHFPDRYEVEKQRGWDYLYARFKAGTLYDREPIGLYFARLWYSEYLYNVTFLLNALYTELNAKK